MTIVAHKWVQLCVLWCNIYSNLGRTICLCSRDHRAPSQGSSTYLLRQICFFPEVLFSFYCCALLDCRRRKEITTTRRTIREQEGGEGGKEGGRESAMVSLRSDSFPRYVSRYLKNVGRPSRPPDARRRRQCTVQLAHVTHFTSVYTTGRCHRRLFFNIQKRPKFQLRPNSWHVFFVLLPSFKQSLNSIFE